MEELEDFDTDNTRVATNLGNSLNNMYVNIPQFNASSVGYADSTPIFKEFKLTDGTKAVFRLTSSTILSVSERKFFKFSFCCKFPFFKKHEQKYVHVEYLDEARPNRNDILSMDVGCDLKSFCKYVDCDYKSWSETMMDIAVKTGKDFT